ncbi:uncharacterized protein SPSC_05682 [Sporisorium scitamineum]|uniref:Queuosine 5'-phosphate N-glycosylase/hydrolase n=2 Tax=Sporisorium scitamineum TaxID=49012 RepID=A0A127Z4S1_9BASI|nr:uncharacterized protein SPSC_05682 [Sporisorium scitamineum]
MSSSPLPSTTDYIAATRSSCLEVSTALNLLPDIPSIDAFLLSLDHATFSRLCTQHGLSFPLRFPTPTAEINFLSILALLNAFSAYRGAFHRATGMGAYQNVVRLLMGMYISSEEDGVVGAKGLTSEGMVEVGEGRVVELLGVSVHEEREHETLKGVVVGVRGGEMLQVVRLIVDTLQGVGRKLVEKNFSSLGAYVVQLLQQTKSKNLTDQEATNYLVQQLATTLPEFRDTHHLPTTNQNVYLFKRIFFLLHSLHLKFPNHHHPSSLHIPNTTPYLPMFVDNVLPTLCVYHHLLSPPPTLPRNMQTLHNWITQNHHHHHLTELTRTNHDHTDQTIVVEGPQLTVDETYAVRAATLNVGRVVVERAKVLAEEGGGVGGREWLAGLNEVDLDGYLWAVAKDDATLRKVPRFRFASVHF